jgi:exodeoxyribonuclease V alpha subunit
MNRDNKFTGRIDHVIYESDEEDSEFAILSVDKDKGWGEAKVKGEFPFVDIQVGTRIQVKGAWNKHPEYGWTMKADWAQEIVNSKVGLKVFLEQHVDQIGDKTSSRLVDDFGTQLIDWMDRGPEHFRDQLEDTSYLRSDQIENFLEAWDEVQQRQELAVYLYGLGLSSKQVVDALNEFGHDVQDRIEENPFCLLEVSGIGFKTCNKISANLDFDLDSQVRIKGAILGTLLDEARQSGHLYLPQSDLYQRMVEKMVSGGAQRFRDAVDPSKYGSALETLQDEEYIVYDGGDVYLWDHYRHESYCARRISEWSEESKIDIDVDQYIDDWEERQNITLSDKQRQAVEALQRYRVVVVSGLPGTGKTTVIQALAEMCTHAGMNTHLMAPTGIAAKRLEQVTGYEAGTIHRILGYGGEGQWQYNEDHKFPTDVVIVDEVSMVSQKILYRLISALERDTTLVLVGDHAQLPSVGAGNVLGELLSSETVEKVRLTKIFRQEEASDLVLNAHRINRGDEPTAGDVTDPDTDFNFIQDSRSKSIASKLLKLVQRVDETGDSYQVLSPRYAGDLGVDELNQHIRDVINPLEEHDTEHSFSHMTLREGDRVMVTQNDYELEVFNGEIAYVDRINPDAKVMELRFPSDGNHRVIKMEFSDAASLLTLAYCTTVHKCQGQEYDHIVFPFVSDFGIQLQRNLLYTAITRAKDQVFILGEWQAVMKAVRREDNKDRYSRLGDRVDELSGQQDS